MLAVAIGTMGPFGVVGLATATPSSAQPTCTDNWIGPDTGTTNWGASASNWSSGIPNGSAVACVNEAGSYTVLFNNAGQTPEALEVGGATSGTQIVEINGANMSTTQDDVIEGGGVLNLVPTSSTDADITGGASNDLTIDTGGSLTSSGASEEADIGLTLDNQGTMTFGAATNIVGGNTTTNQGSLTVLAGATVTENSATFTDASGTLTNDGTFNGENEFVQSGTTESGNPVVQHSGTFIDSAGTGSFETVASTTLDGTIPVGQTLTNLASPGNSNDTIGSSSAGVTVDGTLACQTVSGTICSFSTDNGTWPGITVASGGTVETTGPGNETTYVNLSTDIQIEPGGMVSIANPVTNLNSYGVTDDGTLQVTATGQLIVGGDTPVDAAGGTIGVTAGTTGGTIDFTSGTLSCGTLAVATAGSAADEDVISTPGGEGCDFDSYTFGPDYYTVTYVTNGSDEITTVEVTSATPFSASPTSFSAAENEQVTTPEVATFDTDGEPGTYSATVNYGDATGTQTASVDLSGDSGTVTGPDHTYTAPGHYTVTTTISTTSGTTISVSESVTVTGPTITSFSPSSGPVGTVVTIRGTNLAGASSVTFNGVVGTIKKDTATKIKVEVPSGATKGKIEVSTPGGNVESTTKFKVT